MNSKLLLISLIVGFSSCATMYKSGQTPDDVYYSPAPPQNDYVKTETANDNNNNIDNSTYEDREIRRGIYNRRLRVYDSYDYDYGNNYQYGYNNPFIYSSPYVYNNYGSPYSYQPYGYSFGYNYYPSYSYYPPVYSQGKSSVYYNQPRRYNLGAYGNSSGTVLRPTNPLGILRPAGDAPQANGTGVGNLIRRVFTPANRSSSNPDYSTPSRTFEPARNNSTNSSPSGSSSNSGSSGGGNAPVRSFPK